MTVRSELKTYENIQYFKSCLSDLKLALSGSTNSEPSFVDKKISEVLGDDSTLFKKYLDKKELTLGNVLQALDKLQEELEIEDTVELTIAFEPSEDFVNKLSKWFSSNVSESVVLNLHVEPELVGGVLINASGNYVDHSVKKKLKTNFAKKATKLNE
jgi:F0F1-type ATP synthase delta subunit